MENDLTVTVLHTGERSTIASLAPAVEMCRGLSAQVRLIGPECARHVLPAGSPAVPLQFQLRPFSPLRIEPSESLVVINGMQEHHVVRARTSAPVLPLRGAISHA